MKAQPECLVCAFRFLLKAKCPLVAAALGVRLGDLVFKARQA